MDRESIADLFSAFGPVHVKRMFSGFGVYADDVCFGLFLRGEFYFKTDETTIPQYQAEGCRPFSYVQPTSGKAVTVNSFWRLPERLYDDQDELADWARAALAVARRLNIVKRPKRTSRRKAKADDAKRAPSPRNSAAKVATKKSVEKTAAKKTASRTTASKMKAAPKKAAKVARRLVGKRGR